MAQLTSALPLTGTPYIPWRAPSRYLRSFVCVMGTLSPPSWDSSHQGLLAAALGRGMHLRGEAQGRETRWVWTPRIAGRDSKRGTHAAPQRSSEVAGKQCDPKNT